MRRDLHVYSWFFLRVVFFSQETTLHCSDCDVTLQHSVQLFAYAHHCYVCRHCVFLRSFFFNSLDPWCKCHRLVVLVYCSYTLCPRPAFKKKRTLDNKCNVTKRSIWIHYFSSEGSFLAFILNITTWWVYIHANSVRTMLLLRTLISSYVANVTCSVARNEVRFYPWLWVVTIN